MQERREFREKINTILVDIGEDVLSYDKSEFWMVQSPFEYLEYYAIQKQLKNMYIALYLARGLHDGTHRKSSIIKNGKTYRLPYLIHPLSVCRMLADLNIPISHDEEDILLAAALCHDMIEDIPFEHKGKELYEIYHLDPRVYETVLYVSKRKDFTEEEEIEFFHNIKTHELALLIKLSDRGHNVEDLYNMSVWKVHEYVDETSKFFIPMCDYAIENYIERMHTFDILRNKIISLTYIAEVLVSRYSREEMLLQNEIDALRKENEELRRRWKELWEE